MSWIGFLNVLLLTFLHWIIPGENHYLRTYFFFSPPPQVKPMELTDFLQLKKSEGYCIVGVEQTANSQSLQDYKFPEKTLLLLGYDSI